MPAWLVYAAIRMSHPSNYYPNSRTIEAFKMIMIIWSNAGQKKVHRQYYTDLL